MTYYLRTLEGVSRPLGGWILDVFNSQLIENRSAGKYRDMKETAFVTFKELREYLPRESFEEIYNSIREKYAANPSEYYGIYSAMLEFRRVESTRQAAAAAAESATAQEEKRNEQMIVINEYEPASVVEEAEEILNEGEQMSDYNEHMNNFVQTAVEDNKKLIVSQNIELPETTISEFPEYSVLWEDDKSITYQDDETGEIHTDPKAESVAGWILAAAAGLLLLI
jgi:hypothetical protein